MRYEVTIATYDGLTSVVEVDARTASEARILAKRNGAYAHVTVMDVRPVGGASAERRAGTPHGRHY